MGTSRNADGEAVHPKGSKYDRILEAALRCFALNGFHETKISEIARTAGVADGTIYNYFKNKDDLLISLFEAHLEAINTGARAELAEENGPLEKIERFIRYHLRLAQDNPILAVFITIETRRSHKFVRDYAKEHLKEYLGHLGAAIDEGKAAGLIRPEISSGVLKQILFGALDHACMIWVNNPNRRREDLDVVGDELIGIVARSAHLLH